MHLHKIKNLLIKNLDKNEDLIYQVSNSKYKFVDLSEKHNSYSFLNNLCSNYIINEDLNLPLYFIFPQNFLFFQNNQQQIFKGTKSMA